MGDGLHELVRRRAVNACDAVGRVGGVLNGEGPEGGRKPAVDEHAPGELLELAV